MYNVKGFLTIKPWINNDIGVVAPVGELSTYAMTFSRDIGYYNRPNNEPDIELVTFFVAENDTKKKMSTSFRDELLPVLNWIYTEAAAGNFGDESSLFVDALINQFPNAIDSVESGSMVAGDSAGIYMPEYVTLQLLNVAEDNRIQVWFSDAAFRDQYDEFEILVVPPLSNIDDLIDEPNAVRNAVDAVTPTQWQEWIEQTKNQQPPTLTRVETYTWSYPNDQGQVIEISTSWALIIYGRAGNNIDAINLRLENFVLDESAFGRSTWEQYIPDLFRSTEIVIIPFWDQYSIPNETLEAGLYSPTIPIHRVLPTAKEILVRYDDAHIEDNVHTSVTMYRNLAFMAISSPENRSAFSDFKKAFSDYVALPTTSTEYDRMSQYTRDWLQLFQQLLQTAETMDEFSAIPFGQTRLFRGVNDQHMYIVASYDGIQYLVLSRKTYLDTVNSLFGSS